MTDYCLCLEGIETKADLTDLKCLIAEWMSNKYLKGHMDANGMSSIGEISFITRARLLPNMTLNAMTTNEFYDCIAKSSRVSRIGQCQTCESSWKTQYEEQVKVNSELSRRTRLLKEYISGNCDRCFICQKDGSDHDDCEFEINYDWIEFLTT